MMMMMISTLRDPDETKGMKKRRRLTDDESVRRFLPLENGRRDVFGLVSLLLLLDVVPRGGGFFRRFVAITAPLLLRVVARRCHDDVVSR